MGRLRRTNLAGALFTPVQQRVLGLLFGQPERRFQSAEVIRLAKSGTGAVHRQLARLEGAGLVTVSRSGNQEHYRASRSSPVFDELHGIVVKTVAVVEPIRRALERKARRIVAARVEQGAGGLQDFEQALDTVSIGRARVPLRSTVPGLPR